MSHLNMERRIVMMYCRLNGKKLLWIHCPKTSGRSQHVWLEGNSEVTPEDQSLYQRVRGEISKIHGMVHPDHETLEMNYIYGGDEAREYTPVITIREPLDWHQSWYHYYKQKGFEENGQDLLGLSFVEYCRWIDGVHSGHIEPKRQGGRYHCLMNQSDWIWDGERYRIENTLDFANVRNDFSVYMKENFGVENAMIGHINKTSYRVVEREPHTQETIDIIHKWFEKDFEVYEQVRGRHD